MGVGAVDRGELVARALSAVALDRAVELCQEVVRIPSVLGEEGQLAHFLASTLKELDFEGVALQPVLPDRPNATGKVDFGPGRTVVLTGHLDTKPVSHGWTDAEPYSGDLVDGRVYGHGIMDMKAALVCQMVALAGVAASGVPLKGSAAFSAVSDHMGDQLGSIAYFDEHDADLCVLGELTDNTICIGHRGRYYFDVHVVGRSAHTCHKYDAVNANYLAALAIIELDGSRLLPPLEQWVSDLFGPEAFVVPGRVYGGLPPGGPSMIPDECVIRVDCRPQPGVDVATMRSEIDRRLAAAGLRDGRFRAEVVLADEKPGYLVDPEAEVVQLMREAVSATNGDGDSSPLTVQGWLGDTASFGQRVPTVIYGPGGPPVYCPNEHLSVADIHEATLAYAAFTTLALAE